MPGLANRIIGKFVGRIFITFPKSKHYFPMGKCMLTGNPVREELLELARGQTTKENATTLLVIGGSLGAHKVNTLVVEALKLITDDLPEGFQVIHQTGRDDEQEVSRAYSDLGISAEVAAFYDDMASVFKSADLVVSRAGATSLAEMAVLGKPMILIPYPYAADDHQRENGQFLVDGGAARMFIQDELEPSLLAEEIRELFSNNAKRKKMAESARRLGNPDAVHAIVKEIEKLALGERGC